MTDDAALLRRYASERSEEAFAELVQRHLNLVYRSALRQLGGDAHRAEDVTQSVFALLAHKAASLSGHPNLTGWLYTTTHLTVSRVRRTERRRQDREQEAQTMHELSSDAALPANWDRVRPVLDSVMQDLNQSDREVILLRFFEERPFAQIGAKLCLSEDAARMRVERALDQLRAKLTGRGVTSTTVALALALTSEAVAAVPTGLAATVTNAALASAAAMSVTGGGTATTLNLFRFMSTTKTIAIVATAIAFIAIGTASLEYNEILQARSALAAADREQNELHNRLASAADMIKSLRAQLEALQEQLAALNEHQTSQAKQQNTAAVDNSLGYLSAIASLREPLPGMSHLGVHLRFFGFLSAYKQLPLQISVGQPGKGAGLLDLLALKSETAFTTAIAAVQEGVDTETAIQRVTNAQDSVNAQIRAQYGEDAYAQYQQWQQAIPSRNTISQLQQMLSTTATPLTDDQSTKLTQLLTQTKLPDEEGNLDMQIFDNVGSVSRISPDTITQAAALGLLSQPQLQALQQLQTQQAARAANR